LEKKRTDRYTRHYHIVAADIIGSSRFLKDGRDDIYKTVLDDFYRMVRKTQVILSKKYRFINRDKVAGIYPLGGDSFWMFIPASRANRVVEDSFAFTINAVDTIRGSFLTAFAIHGLDIRIGVHTTIKEKIQDGSTEWGLMDEGLGAPRHDPVYKMPLFNRIFSRDFVVAKRLEQAAGEGDFSSHVLFSREFVLRMSDYGGKAGVKKSGNEVKLRSGGVLRADFIRHPVEEMVTARLREKLIECRVEEVYEIDLWRNKQAPL
jgi:hypothetical protein